MRKEMAKVVPEIADTPTTTHKEINRLRGKFPKEAIAELHRELRGKLPTTKKPLNPRQKRSEAQRRRWIAQNVTKEAFDTLISTVPSTPKG